MKKRTLRRIAMLALVLCLVTTSLLSGTLASYSTTVTGTGAATVADWEFKANSQESAFTFNMNGTGVNNKILPGNSSTIDLVLLNNSDMAADYDIRITVYPDDDANFSFNLTNAAGGAITSLKRVAGTLLGGGGTETVKIYWAYADIAAPTAAAGVAQSVTITVTGAQSSATSASAAQVVDRP